MLFVEDFETGTVLALGERWGNATQPENMSFSPDIPPNSPGNRSLRIAKTGHLFTHTRGVDRMHARFYVKFSSEDCWRTFSVAVKDSTTVRFRLKPLADVSQVTVMIWSDQLKDNARYHIGGLKQGEWRPVEFRAIEARAGWAADGASLDGAVLNNVKILFEGPPDARLLLDDFEVTE